MGERDESGARELVELLEPASVRELREELASAVSELVAARAEAEKWRRVVLNQRRDLRRQHRAWMGVYRWALSCWCRAINAEARLKGKEPSEWTSDVPEAPLAKDAEGWESLARTAWTLADTIRRQATPTPTPEASHE